MKEHDYFLELMSNPTFNSKDFLLVGLNSQNTELLDKSKYKSSKTVLDFELFLTNGKFDEKKFDAVYEQALQQYNELAELTEANKPFFRDDIFAPDSLKNEGYESTITKVANPLRKQSGFVDFGISEEPTKSVRELAEANVQYDYKTGKWIESPNEKWWDNFFNPKVLAQWDFDADKDGNPTSDKDKIVYHKGEKKIDPLTGTYYYESLGGRSIYGREVLSGFDTLTTDGSAWNKYDFFDSDDIKKSTFGNLSRAVVQIAPVFIPYVNTAYMAARIGISMSEIMPTIGKIFLGSDNELMSQIEGWNKAFSFSTSDYTQGSEELGIEANPWTTETGLKLISDVFTLLAEQRFLFKYGSAFASRLNPKMLGEGKKAEEARKAYLEAQTAKDGLDLNIFKRAKTKEELDLILKSELGIKWARAEAALNERIKNGQDIAKNLSMAYMTGITTASSYGEAKQQGATDFEAAAFALGYSIGEWLILRSDIGKWILPELKLEKFELLSIAKALSAVTDKEVQGLAKKATKEEKKNLFRKFVDLGRQAATGHYADNTITNTAKMTVASALSEGFEETSEELLADFSKTIFNIATELGSGAKFEDNWKDMATRYSMSFLGGTLGGAIATGLPGYRAARQRQRDIINSVNNPNANTEAYLKLVNLVLNGKALDYKDTVNKMNFSKESLSDRVVINSDGTSSYEPALSYEDSLEFKVKQKLIEQVDIVEDILNSYGADFKLSDDQLLDELTRKQLRFYSLVNSNVLGVYTNEYANYITRLVDVAFKIDLLEKKKNGVPKGESDADEREAKKEKELWTKTEEAELKKRKDELKEIQDKLKMYRDGTMANEFIAEALWEMTVPISSIYGPTGFAKWVEDTEGKKFEEVLKDSTRYEELKKLWDDGSISRREIVHRNYQVFKHNQQAFIDLLNKHEQNYFTDNEENVIRNLEELFLGDTGREKKLSEVRELDRVETATLYILDGLRLAGKANFGLNEDILNALLLGIKGKVDLPIYDDFKGKLDSFKLTFAEYFGFNVPQTIEDYLKLTDELRLKLEDRYREVLQDRPVPTDNEENFLNIIKIINETFVLEKLEDFDGFISSFLLNIAVLDLLMNIIKSAKYLTPATKLYLKNFISQANVTDENKKYIERLNLVIDSVKSSPLEELLSQMVYSLTESGFNTTGMVTDLALLVNDLANGTNLGEFAYSDEIENKINRAIQLIDIASAHINAARTEYYGTIGDVFGYNSTVNELSEKYPPETDSKSKEIKLKKLPELQTGTADSMLHELAKLRNDLEFYKSLYNANSSKKLTEHIKQEAILNQIYYANIQKLTVDIPDDWDKSELNKAINEATNLKNTKDKDKLSLEERKATFKERLRIEKAIYNLFLKNKIKDLKQFKQIFKLFLDFESVKESTINVDMKKLDNIDFVWYIASLTAVDPEAVYKEYVEALGDPRYTPIIGQEEAIRRAYSYLINPHKFEEFLEYVNLIIEELVSAEGKIDGFDVENYILSSRHFLIEGDPGSGKTTATYNALIRMLANNHSELLEDVWIVSNSEENANKTIEDLGLETAIGLSKEEYFKRISENYHQKFKDGELQIFSDEVVKDEKGIYHYKDETLKDIKAPKLILFDEITNFSQLDLLLSHKFHKKYNLYSLGAGDFKQLGAKGYILEHTGEKKDSEGNIIEYDRYLDPKDGKPVYLGMSNANFIGSWKLGTSVRSNNSYKTGNITKLGLSFNIIFENINKINNELPFSPITFSYYLDPKKGLFGDKIETNIDKAIETIKVMLDNLEPDKVKTDPKTGELKITRTVINFITDNYGSELALAVKNLNESEKYKDRIKFIDSGASQGLEGQYYIIDLLNSCRTALVTLKNNTGKDLLDLPKVENFIKAFYTAISRAKQGSLIFGHYGDPETSDIKLFNSIPQTKLQEYNLSLSIKDANTKERQTIIKEALGDTDISTPNIDWGNNPKIEPDNPNDDDDDDETEVVPDEEITTEEEVLKRNTDSPTPIENKEEGKLNILIHTFMCNETGCKVIDDTGQPNKTMDPLDDKALLQLGEFHESRTDNIHGLVKLAETSGNTIDPFSRVDKDGKRVSKIKINDQGIITEGKEELIILLNKLREAGRNYTDYDKLVSKIQSLLDTEEPLGIDFIYDLYFEDYDGDEYTIEKFRDKYVDYQERYRGKDENLSGIINDDNSGEEIHLPRNGVISMVITMGNGKRLVRIPLAKITSPLTLLAQEEFKEIREIYKKVRGDHHEFKKEIKKALINKENIPHLLEFAMLLDIYLGTAFNNIAYLNKLFNGTLAGYAKPTGITVTNKPKGEDYLDKKDSYYYNGRWVAISKYKKVMPWRNVSQIMVCVDRDLISLNDKQITPGKPFVLVSDTPELSDVDSKTLLDYYVKLMKDPSVQPLVKLVEVIPPSLDSERYLFNLHTALNVHKNKDKEIDKDLGTKNTSFRLLSLALLKTDSKFVNTYEKFIKDNIKDEVKKVGNLEINLYKKAIAEFNRLKELLSALVEYEKKNGTHSLYNLLNTPVSRLDKNDTEINNIVNLLKYKVEGESRPRFLLPTNNDKLTLRHLFQRKLNEMLFNTELGSFEEVIRKNGNNIEYLKPEIKLRVLDFIESIDWKEVLLHTRVKSGSNFDPILIDDDTILNVALVETNYGNDYAIGKDGGEYRINGKIDSTLYVLDIVPMLKWILVGALGRDPEVIDTNIEDNENIFAVTDKAMSVKKGNNAQYYEERPFNRETEEEKRVKKLLSEDCEKLRSLTPRDFSKKGLGNKKDFIKKFSELDEETRKKVLEDPREFIYLNLGILSFKQANGNYKFFISTKGAENVRFNSNGTTSFVKDGKEYILDDENGAKEEIEIPLKEKGLEILNSLGYKNEDRHSNGHIKGGQSGWKLRFVVTNPKTGKAFTQAEVNADKDAYYNAATPLLEYLIEYFKNPDGTDKIELKKLNGLEAHYIYIDKEGNRREPFKFLTGGEVGESDFTIYIGSKDDVDKFIEDVKNSPIYNLLSFGDNSSDTAFNEKIHGRIEGRSIGFSGYNLPDGLEKIIPEGTIVYEDDLVAIISNKDGYIINSKREGKYYEYSPTSTFDIILNHIQPNIVKIRNAIAEKVYGEYITGTLSNNFGNVSKFEGRNQRVINFLTSINPIGKQYGYVFPSGNNIDNADSVAITLAFAEVKIGNCYNAKINPKEKIKGTDKTFELYKLELLSTEEGKQLLKDVEFEMSEYLKDPNKYRKNNSCGTLSI